MKKEFRLIVLLILMVMMIGALVACEDKESGNDSKPQNDTITKEVTLSPTAEVDDKNITPTVPVSDVSPTPTDEVVTPTVAIVDNLETEEYSHTVLPVKMLVPKAARRDETKESLYAETDEYLLYVFSADTYNNGIILNEVDVSALAFSEEKIADFCGILQLQKAEIAKDTEVVLYNNINGMGGFSCELSKIVLLNKAGDEVNGTGVVFVYGKKDEIGVFVAVGVLKDSNSEGSKERTEKVREMLVNCISSLQQTRYEDVKYDIWREKLPDETEIIAVYKEGEIFSTETVDDGCELFYKEDKTGYFLIQHWKQKTEVASAKEYLENLKKQIGEDGVVFSEIGEAKGKMTYSYMTLSFSENGTDYTEKVYVSKDENGSLWLVDLYGTKADVETQTENLSILLWSLQEE